MRCRDIRLEATLALGMGVTYVNLLFLHGVSDQIKDRIISMIEYKDSKVYDCFNNPFPDDSDTPALDPPTITINDSPRLNKITWYTSDPLPSNISFASGNCVSTLSTSFNSPQLLEPNYHDHGSHHTIMSDNPFRGRTKI